VRGWTGTETVTRTSRSTYSSAAFVKRSSEEDHTEGVPTSSTTDRGVVVGWGPNEKSQLYVRMPQLRMGADTDGQP